MEKEHSKDPLETFEQALKGSESEPYNLTLFVAGMRPISIRAVANIKEVCERHLQGQYHLEVVDAYKSPHLVVEEQIVALPTLIKRTPQPFRRIVGDLSDTGRVLNALNLNL